MIASFRTLRAMAGGLSWPGRIELPKAATRAPQAYGCPPHARLRAVFALAPGVGLPRVGRQSLAQYRCYLADHLAFPFTATHYDVCDGEPCDHLITVTRLLETTGTRGLECEVLAHGQPVTVSLDELRPASGGGNRQLTDDYRDWLANCRATA